MITWKITAMESQPDTGIVISANWVCIGEQNGFTSQMSGISVFPIPENGYIPYSELNQNQVLNWVWTDGGVNQFATESSIMSAIQYQINPPVIEQPLPWK